MTQAISSTSGAAAALTSTTAKSTSLSKDDFLKLLVTQLRHQDPLNPLDQNQFLAQTAQFSSLESLQNIDKGLQSLQATASGSALTQAAALIGMHAQTSGAEFAFDGRSAALPVTLDGNATAVAAEITDAGGNVVRVLMGGAKGAGAYTIPWDGRDADGNTLMPGTYRYRVSAAGAHAIAADGVLAGATVSGGRVSYQIGDFTVRQDDIIDVRF